MPELALTPAKQLPAVVQPRRTVLDVLDRFKGAPEREQPSETWRSAVTRGAVYALGVTTGSLGFTGLTIAPYLRRLDITIPETMFFPYVAGSLALLLAGAIATRLVPPKRMNDAELATKRTLAVTKSLPLPAADAPKVERAVVALLALWSTNESKQLDASPEGKSYREAAKALLATVDAQEVSAIENVLEKLYAHDGHPLSQIHEIDCLAASIRTLDPELRTELMAYLEPHITSIRPREASWRNDALSAAIEGKDYAYGALASKELAEPAPNTPERLRLDALDKEIAKQLEGGAHRAGLLFAQVVVPEAVALEHALRLAGKYEDLGYRAYMHREQRGVRLSITSPDGMLRTADVEGGYEERPASAHRVYVE